MWQLLIGAALGYAAGKSGREPGSLRPAVKAAVKAGVRAFEKGGEAMARLRESLDDIAAEVRSDLEEEEATARAAHEVEEEEPAPPPRSVRPKSQPHGKNKEEQHANAPTSHR